MIVRGGGVPRWNGSLYYPAKIPDLIGVKERKYIDHTGTHLHRGIGDLMRYAALVSFADTTDYSPHHMLPESATRPKTRLSDEALYALAVYIYSLQPPSNPNPFDERAAAGQRIFANRISPDDLAGAYFSSRSIRLLYPGRPIPLEDESDCHHVTFQRKSGKVRT